MIRLIVAGFALACGIGLAVADQSSIDQDFGNSTGIGIYAACPTYEEVYLILDVEKNPNPFGHPHQTLLAKVRNPNRGPIFEGRGVLSSNAIHIRVTDGEAIEIDKPRIPDPRWQSTGPSPDCEVLSVGIGPIRGSTVHAAKDDYLGKARALRLKFDQFGETIQPKKLYEKLGIDTDSTESHKKPDVEYFFRAGEMKWLRNMGGGYYTGRIRIDYDYDITAETRSESRELNLSLLLNIPSGFVVNSVNPKPDHLRLNRLKWRGKVEFEVLFLDPVRQQLSTMFLLVAGALIGAAVSILLDWTARRGSASPVC